MNQAGDESHQTHLCPNPQGFQNIVINHMGKGTMCFVAYAE